MGKPSINDEYFPNMTLEWYRYLESGGMLEQKDGKWWWTQKGIDWVLSAEKRKAEQNMGAGI